MSTDVQRWMGLKDLIQDGIEHGASALERLQKDVVVFPFLILERAPVVGPAAQVAHVLHDAVVSVVYATVRGVGRSVGDGVGAVLRRIR